MELRKKIPADDKFDMGAFLRRQLETCASDMKEVIRGMIGFMEETKPTKVGAKKEKREEMTEQTRKRPRDETYKTLKPKMRKLQQKLVEGPTVRRRFSRKFWADYRPTSGGIAAQWGCRGADMLIIDDLDSD